MDELIAGEDDLQKFNSTPDAEKRVTSALRGVLVEIATFGINRYPWELLRPLVYHRLDAVLAAADAEGRVEVGPTAPLPGGDTLDTLRARLHTQLDAFGDAPPFTLQRLAELLVEPQKQYTRLSKLALALERLLLVTSTAPQTVDPPPRPSLAALPAVNENPPSPSIPTQQQGHKPRLPNGVLEGAAANSRWTGSLFHSNGQVQSSGSEPARGEGSATAAEPPAAGTETPGAETPGGETPMTVDPAESPPAAASGNAQGAATVDGPVADGNNMDASPSDGGPGVGEPPGPQDAPSVGEPPVPQGQSSEAGAGDGQAPMETDAASDAPSPMDTEA